MNSRVAIYSNGLVPGNETPCGAQGLRAMGLQQGLASAGFEVDIVCNANIVHSQLKKWDIDTIRIPAGFRALSDDALIKHLADDYQTVILMNWAGFPQFKKASGQRFVYDFFSPTLIEHSYFVGAEELLERERKKIAIAAQADIFIANGAGLAKYGRRFLEKWRINNPQREVFKVRLGLPQNKLDSVDNHAFRIFSGGYDQVWTKGVHLSDLKFLSDACQAEIHTIGIGHHLHFHNSAQSARGREIYSQNVIEHPVSSFERYCKLNAKCHVALDVFEPNSERFLSYSTRAITSISNGCPLITMKFTEIGKLVDETGCGWTLEDFSINALRDLLNGIRKSPDELNKKRLNTERFWAAYCDPAKEITRLVGALV